MIEDRDKLQTAILADIRSRSSWETRQRDFYTMRTSGIRLRNKPFPGAADLHFPLVDTTIEKLKPFYAQQLYASECLAAFVSRSADVAQHATAASYWFDYEMKQCSPFEMKNLQWDDIMLERGKSLLKVYWDESGDCLGFDALSPQEVIVPPTTKELQSTGRIVHVLRMSESQYRANKRYTQSDELISKIKGKGDNAGQNTLDEKERIEGLTVAADQNEIILWEIYQKDGDKVFVDTMSPLAPSEAIRKKFRLPYIHERNGADFKTLYPFVDLNHEVRDKGWYSSRGIAELLAHFEASLCRMWNEKHNAMSFYNRPVYYSEREVPNTANISTVPGAILPFAIQPVPQNRPPVSWDEEMISTRMIAEQRVAVPDFGLTNQKNSPGSRSGTSARTATEVTALSGLATMSADLRARIKRKALSEVYRQAWALLVQFRKAQDIDFLRDGETLQIGRDARQLLYFIEPSGSADGWNKEQAFQKAVARAQMLNGNPFINQGELWKSVLEADDPRLVKRLYQDPGIDAQDQMEDQAQELSVLQMGFPARVKPADDDAAHIRTILAYLSNLTQIGQPILPMVQQALDQHIMAHLQQAQQKDPKAARQLQQEIAQAMQQWQQMKQTRSIAAMPQPTPEDMAA